MTLRRFVNFFHLLRREKNSAATEDYSPPLRFPGSQRKFLETAYTCNLEESLDEIASGKQCYLTVVTDVNTELQVGLTALNSISNTSIACPSCQAPMRRINGKNGSFLGCSRYKDGCKSTLPDNDAPQNTSGSDDAVNYLCPKCNKPLRRINGKYGFFWSCSGYKEGCKVTTTDKKGKPLPVFLCPKCNQLLKQIKAKNGYFWRCSKFDSGCATTFKDFKGKPELQYLPNIPAFKMPATLTKESAKIERIKS